MNVDSDFLTLRLDSPLRPPDWRPQLAAALHEGRMAFVATRRKDVPDELVRKLLTQMYGWRWDAPSDDEWAAMQAATAWHTTASADAVLEVQARLLAAQTDDVIAAAVGTSPEVVDYYEKLFYSCRDRLWQRSFIAGVFLNAGGPTPTVADAVRRAAYRFGPLGVELFLAAVRGPGWETDTAPPTTATEFAAAADHASARRWLAFELVPPDYPYRRADAEVLVDLSVRRPHRIAPFALEPLPLHSNPDFGRVSASTPEIEIWPENAAVRAAETAVGLSALTVGRPTGYDRPAEIPRVGRRRPRTRATDPANV